MEKTPHRVVGDVDDLDPTDLRRLVTEHADVEPVLAGQSVAGVFEHPSMRTRSAFAVAAAALGATPVFLTADEVGVDVREPAGDIAEVLVRHHALVGARLRRHESFRVMAGRALAHGRPIVNLLTDRAHPTQALADAITVYEALGTTEGVVAAWVGDANNVARSFAKAMLALGAELRIATPPAHRFAAHDVAEIRAYGERASADPRALRLVEEPRLAVRGAHVVATDVWVSMGEERDKRRDFDGWQVNAELLAEAAPGVGVLHCLPAHRGDEITAEVIDGPHSWVFRQAEHRATAMVRLWWLLLGGDVGRVRRRW